MATCFGPSWDHIQANILKEEVQSVCTMYYGIPYYKVNVKTMMNIQYNFM
jgi:hypothetical protein